MSMIDSHYKCIELVPLKSITAESISKHSVKIDYVAATHVHLLLFQITASNSFLTDSKKYSRAMELNINLQEPRMLKRMLLSNEFMELLET